MRRSEQGIVSILVTMIMVIVISLIVLGFAEVTRRNSREALDNQLSSQAYYAAESGVNTAANWLSAHPTALVNTTDCRSFIVDAANGLGGTYSNNSNTDAAFPNATNVLNATSNIRYNCLMVNTTPDSLETKPLNQDTTKTWHIANADGAAFGTFTFDWDKQTGSPRPAGCNETGYSLPAYDSWPCQYGILRVDLVPVSGGSLNKANIETNSSSTVTTLYMIPSLTTGTSSPVTVNAPSPATSCAGMPGGVANCPAQIVLVRCAASGCSLTLTLGGGSNEYYARLTMLYQDSDRVTLTATDAGVPGVSSDFSGGQAVIDSTGQAQDELRRVQVRLPLALQTTDLPLYALQSTDEVCKQLNVGPSVPYIDECP